ncbi:helix-turn-helix transcriptional regulator [Embleya sp. NPDC005971]|uniref:helix-turn-helix domain-containing protein n=1 Tax=unclassified Embleya TaxID=2699296 RepID=UPI0034099E80
MDAAATLRALRRERGMTVDAVAAQAGWAKSSQSRLETGHMAIAWSHVVALTGPLQLTPVMLARLARMIGAEDTSGPHAWWTQYESVLSTQYEELIHLESQALGMVAASTLVPGIMQAEEYARETIMRSAFVPDPDDAEALLAVRLRRQETVSTGQAHLAVTLSEAALWNAFCGRLALRRQLRYLLELGQLTNVSLRIVPYDARSLPFLGAVTILDLPAPSTSVTHVEYEAGAQLIRGERVVKRYRRDLALYRDTAASEDVSEQMILQRVESL